MRILTRGKEGDDLVKTLLSNFERLKTGSRDVEPTVDKDRKCTICNSCVVSHAKENIMVCETCGLVQGVCELVKSYQSQGNYSYFTKIHQYKRLTRFREVLRQVQGLGGGFIPAHVEELVKQEAGKYKHHDKSISPGFVRGSLRRQGQGCWAEYSVRLAVMCGYKAPMMSHRLEHVLERMFLLCDRAWPLVKQRVYDDLKWKRDNFPSYISVLYSFFLLLDEKKLASYIKPLLLKSVVLAQKQQVYWRYFCYHLDWPFYRIHGSLLSSNSRQRHITSTDFSLLPDRWFHTIQKPCLEKNERGQESQAKRLKNTKDPERQKKSNPAFLPPAMSNRPPVFPHGRSLINQSTHTKDSMETSSSNPRSIMSLLKAMTI